MVFTNLTQKKPPVRQGRSEQNEAPCSSIESGVTETTVVEEKTSGFEEDKESGRLGDSVKTRRI